MDIVDVTQNNFALNIFPNCFEQFGIYNKQTINYYELTFLWHNLMINICRINHYPLNPNFKYADTKS